MPMNTSQLEARLKAASAYGHPEGKRAIDEALPGMYAAETAGNINEVDQLRIKLTARLNEIADNLSPLPETERRWCESLIDDPEHGYDWAPDYVRARFSYGFLDSQPDRARLRASVMGEIEINA
ncbi:hypothetical protein HYW82_00095 [Candidatus Peregrinibacteria bacterium]|nr:hypothetical protein [Candidatus Peregrinibacteria bacterium]